MDFSLLIPVLVAPEATTQYIQDNLNNITQLQVKQIDHDGITYDWILNDIKIITN